MAERLVRKPRDQESLDDYLMYLRHLAVYSYVLTRFERYQTIDLGCGTGYGTTLLGETSKVVGVDRAGHALPTADQRGGTDFCVADLYELPFGGASFDFAVSFQVIEHIRDVHLYLREARRVLSDNGFMAISTPNRWLRLLPLERPYNPYHVREYSPISLWMVLRRHFRNVDLLGLRASPEIELREIEMLRKNRRWLYRHMLLSKLEKLPFGNWGIAAARRAKQTIRAKKSDGSSEPPVTHMKYMGQDVAPHPYSLDDFWVDSSGLSTALDLIAICRK